MRPRLPISVGLMAGVGLALILQATSGNVAAQDWLPFRVAAGFARRCQWSDVYPRDARHLFDMPPVFRAATAQAVGDGPLAIPADRLTAFVAPPPSAFLLVPLEAVSSPVAVIVSRLTLAVPVIAAMLAFGRFACPDFDARTRWSILCLGASPLLAYTVGVGQTSAWLFVACAAAIVGRRSLDVLGGIALGLTIITKATPLAVAVGLITVKRRLGAIALAAAAMVAGLSVGHCGLDGWPEFFASARHAGLVVMPDWANASIDAEVLRWISGQADSLFAPLPPVVMAALWVLKIVAATGVIGWALRRRRYLVNAIWISWLIVSPIVWLHYLVVLVPLAGSASKRRFPVAAACVGGLSLPLVLHGFGVKPVLLGHLASLSWLTLATALLWPERTESLA